jgi:Zn-dependent protease with chaperone function
VIALGAALLLLGLVLAEPASSAMAHARWPQRAPGTALLVWQLMGLVAGTAFLGSAAAFSLGVSGWLAVVLWLVTAALAVRLLGVLVIVGLRTLRTRSRHRQLLDLIATPWPDRPGAAVLDHPAPVAYCLPGLRSRLVVSRGVLDMLTEPQLDAVLAHERTHMAERHDLVVLPFVAWGATFPWLPGVLRSQLAVADLVEIRADDVAAAACGAKNLAAALRAVSASVTVGAGRDTGVMPKTPGANLFYSAAQRRAERVLTKWRDPLG